MGLEEGLATPRAKPPDPIAITMRRTSIAARRANVAREVGDVRKAATMDRRCCQPRTPRPTRIATLSRSSTPYALARLAIEPTRSQPDWIPERATAAYDQSAR